MTFPIAFSAVPTMAVTRKDTVAGASVAIAHVRYISNTGATLTGAYNDHDGNNTYGVAGTYMWVAVGV